MKKTAVYLGNDRIQILTGNPSGGTLKVSYWYSQPLEEGIITNGVITAPEELGDQLKSLRAAKKLPAGALHLVIDSGTILNKLTTMPLAPHKKLQALVADEFADAPQSRASLLFDYSVVIPKNPEGNGGTVLCTATERSLVEGYIDLFTGLNNNLLSIRLGLDCTISLCDFLPELRGKNFILLLLDGKTLVSMLFFQGAYFFYRLLEQRGTPRSVDELHQRVSYIQQFHKSQLGEAELHGLYLCGLEDGENDLAAAVQTDMEISCQELTTSSVLPAKKAAGNGFRLSDYGYTVGCLLP
ncbi:MAG: hypothetical protein RR276_03970 [Angelakisella sp.]